MRNQNSLQSGAVFLKRRRMSWKNLVGIVMMMFLVVLEKASISAFTCHSSGVKVRIRSQKPRLFAMKRNKQLDLMAKMKAAKAKRENPDAAAVETEKSREQIKEENDRKRFDDLLNRQSSFSDDSETTYLTKAQEEEEASAGYKGVDRLFEGDDAPVEVFHSLVKPSSSSTPLPLGEIGAKRIVPWLGSTYSSSEYLIVVTDPRSKSSELKRVVKSLNAMLPQTIKSRMIVVTSDSAKDNFKHMKSSEITSFDIYSDENREFMRQYTALGEKRWAICMFIVADGIIQRIVRELDPDFAPDVVRKAVNSLNL